MEDSLLLSRAVGNSSRHTLSRDLTPSEVSARLFEFAVNHCSDENHQDRYDRNRYNPIRSHSATMTISSTLECREMIIHPATVAMAACRWESGMGSCTYVPSPVKS